LQYIPHGIETQIFKPLDKLAGAHRRAAGPLRGGDVAMNKGNPSRKCFAEMMEAFAKFHSATRRCTCSRPKGRGHRRDDEPAGNVRNMGLVEGQDVVFCQRYQNIMDTPEYMAEFTTAWTYT
jgi:hypothetical protein